MDDRIKYILKIVSFFLLMLFLFYIMDSYYKRTYVLSTSIASTIGYAIILIIEDKKRKRK